jgi:hypothetical protein
MKWWISSIFDGKTVIEVALEKSGDINALQRYRQKIIPRTADEFEIPVMRLISYEYGLRATVQREISLNEELTEKRRSLTEIEKELQDLKKQYWFFMQERCQAKSALPTGPLTRAIDLWRSHPRWYMHQFLVQSCAERGGCCGRDCGCCVNRPIPQSRKLGVGHCTTECGCCAEYRGFDLTEDDKRKRLEIWDISANGRSKIYSRVVLNVLLFGTLETQHISPFDMIYNPPQRQYKPPRHKEDQYVSVTAWSPKPLLMAERDKELGLDAEVCTGEIIDLYGV